jgi:acyl-CoA synthetase (AMP-forming)/AMP-acid ligase II
MPQSTLDRIRAEFPSIEFQQTYGLSEVGVLRSESRKDGSLWIRIGGEGFKTKVINDVLWIKSQYAMVGYLNSPSEFDAEGFFNTQDKVEVDGDYFKILGRVTDIINVAGQKVYPAEVESVILELDNVQDVAVFGESHRLLGNIVVAKILLKETESIESIKKRLRKYCLTKLLEFKIPAKIMLADSSLHSSRQKKIRRH